MPQYAILAEHSPEVCPTSNSKSRVRAIQGLGQDMPRLAAEASITFVTGPLHLDPSHRFIAVVDAPNIEAVTQLSTRRGCRSGTPSRSAPSSPSPT